VSWLVDDIRQAWRWSSVRLNAAVVLLCGLFQVMPALDPQIAHMLPEPVRSPAIGIYALLNLGFRLTKLKGNG
jgi:hypothetical protein